MQKGEKIVILVAATESKPSNSIFNIGINTFLVNFDKVQLKKKIIRMIFRISDY